MKKKTVKKVETVSVGQIEVVRKTELARLNAAIPTVVGSADIIIDSAESETLAYDILVKMKDMLKEADRKRKLITVPLDMAKKETMHLFKESVGPLEDGIRVLSGKITSYRDKQERLAAEAERQRQAEIRRLEAEHQEARQKAEERKTAKGKANAEAKADDIEDKIVELDQTEFVPDAGSATVAKVWTYEIEDDDLVPRQFCSPDRGKLRQAVRDDIREIAGVRIFQQSSVRSR